MEYCKYHNEVDSVVTCKNCNSPLCEACHHNEFTDYCWVCVNEVGLKPQGVKVSSKNKRLDLTNKNWFPILGFYQMISGAIGLSFSLFLFVRVLQQSVLWMTMVSSFYLVYFILIILSGWLTLKRIERVVPLAIIIQLFQIPSFTIGKISYIVMSGVGLFIGFESTSNSAGLNIQSYFLTHFYIHLFEQPISLFSLQLNIVPVIIIYILIINRKLMKKIGEKSS